MSTAAPHPSRSSGYLLDLGLLLIRAIVGIVFVLHGSQKLFGAFEGPGIEGFSKVLETMNVPMPLVSAWAAALAEFVGGLSLLTGLWMRILLIPLFVTMMVASFVAHGDAFFLSNGGMEFALTLGLVVLGLMCTGPGRFSWNPMVRRAIKHDSEQLSVAS